MEMRIYLTTDIELSEEQESWSHGDLEQWAVDLIKSQPSYDMFDLSVATYSQGDCDVPKDSDDLPFCPVRAFERELRWRRRRDDFMLKGIDHE